MHVQIQQKAYIEFLFKGLVLDARETIAGLALTAMSTLETSRPCYSLFLGGECQKFSVVAVSVKEH